MRRIRNCFIALLVGCIAPLVIWVGLGGAIYTMVKEGKVSRKLICSIDSDCPQGFTCVGGRCVPQA